MIKKILLDTDIGNDIDDWFALGYLLSHPDVSLLGVTTVTGTPQRRAALADIVASAYKKPLAIHAGTENPLIVKANQWCMNGDEQKVVDLYPHRNFPENTAIEFMRKTVEENPSEITLVAIGPLTNVALLFATYPHIPRLLRDVVIMGGRFGTDETFDTKRWGVVEWNILCDPHAAAIVFREKDVPIYVAGIEQTYRPKKTPAEMQTACRAVPPLLLAAETVSEWQHIHFHDIVAIYAYLNREDVRWECGTVDVNTTDVVAETLFTQSENGNVLILKEFDIDRFFEDYAAITGCIWK